MHTADMTIETLTLGPLQTTCVVLTPDGGKDCCIVDPCKPLDELITLLEQRGLAVGTIVITHGHGDHLSGVATLTKLFPKAAFWAPAADEYMLADAMANLSAPFGMAATAPQPQRFFAPGETLSLAGRDWRVLDSSGHTPGGATFYCEAAAVAICGDALFCGSIGRCDLPGANQDRLLGNIRDNILTLPDETLLIPGHGPATSVGVEKRTNPYLA